MLGINAPRGFTIIEVMLVLAISGLMTVGILAATAATIATQRYKDSANSVVDYFQGQYSATMNVRNNRSLTRVCSDAGLASGATSYIGTSECTILGRVIRGNGASITAAPVYSTVDPIQLSGITEERAFLLAVKPVEDVASAVPYELEWGAKLYPRGNSAASQRFTIAIIRSPDSGNIHTFINTSSNITTIVQLIESSASLTTDALFCVAPASGLTKIASSPLAVKITRNSATPSGVQLLGQGSGC